MELLKDEDSAFLFLSPGFQIILKEKLNQFYFRESILQARDWYKYFFGTDIGKISSIIKPENP